MLSPLLRLAVWFILPEGMQHIPPISTILYLVHIIWYLCVMNFDLVGESSVSVMILYFIILWLVGCVPLDMTYMRTISSIFLYFPTFVFSHLVFRDGAFCGRLTCLGWVTYANHFYNPLHSLANLGSE